MLENKREIKRNNVSCVGNNYSGFVNFSNNNNIGIKKKQFNDKICISKKQNYKCRN